MIREWSMEERQWANGESKEKDNKAGESNGENESNKFVFFMDSVSNGQFDLIFKGYWAI